MTYPSPSLLRCILFVWLFACAVPVIAQDPVIVPPATVSQYRTDSSATVPYTAAQWKQTLGLFRLQSRLDQPPDRNPYPKDSIRQEVEQRAIRWHNGLNAQQSGGMYMDPDVTLLVAGENDPLAQETVIKRLADASLSQEERAYTLFSAVESFADYENQNRLATARQYLAMLDSLPGDVQYWQYQAHVILANASYLANDRPATVKHAHQAFQYLQKMWYGSRGHFFRFNAPQNMYFAAIEVLVSDEGGQGVDELNVAFLAAMELPPELRDYKVDSSFIWMSRGLKNGFIGIKNLAAMIGKPAPPVMGHRWLNRTDTTAHEETYADGKVRLIGMGRLASGISRLSAFERVAQEVGASTDFEAVVLVTSQGYSGAAFVDPEEEMANIVSHFMVRRPTTIPIAIWTGKKVVDAEGGSRPAPSPTMGAYRVRSSATFLIDGTGRIRRVFEGFGRDREMQAIALIKHLQ